MATRDRILTQIGLSRRKKKKGKTIVFKGRERFGLQSIWMLAFKSHYQNLTFSLNQFPLELDSQAVYSPVMPR